MKTKKLFINLETRISLFLGVFLFFCSLVLLFSWSPALAGTATLSLIPASGTGYIGEFYDIQIRLSTGGENTNATNVIINYNPTYLEVQDMDGGTAGIQIQPGTIYQFYDDNITSGGQIKLTGYAISTPYNSGAGAGTFATIRFKALTSGSTNVTFSFQLGATTDSNVVKSGTSEDILSAVNNTSFTLIPDTNRPALDSFNPTKGATNISPAANITFHAKDAETGINITTVSATVNSINYNYTSSSFAYSGTKYDYTITINPPSDLPYETIIPVSISTNDVAGNSISDSYSFTISSETTPPYASDYNPAKNASNVALNSNVSARVSDTISGVNIDTVKMTVKGIIYTKAGPTNTFSYTGTPNEGYVITVNPTIDFNYNETVPVKIEASDLKGNAMSADNYTFSTGINITPPYTGNFLPTKGASNVKVNTNVFFYIYAGAQRVDIDSVRVIVNGIRYNQTGTPPPGDMNTYKKFEVGGTSQAYSITVKPENAFSSNSTINVSINAQDLSNPPNIMTVENYSFTTGSDNVNPYTSSWYPTKDQTGVPINSSVAVHIYDTGTGININSVRMVINGVNYEVLGSGYPLYYASENMEEYALVAVPEQNYAYNSKIKVEVYAQDLANPSNQLSETYYFTTVEQGTEPPPPPPERPTTDQKPPYTRDWSPQKNEQGVSGNTNFSVQILDDDPGVNLDSVGISINGVKYTKNGVTKFSYSGNEKSYLVMVEPIKKFNPEQIVEVNVYAQDLATAVNSMSETYSFTIAKITEEQKPAERPITESTPPYTSDWYPAKDAKDITQDTRISFKITDAGAGVNLDSLKITAEGIEYVKEGENKFFYSGNKNAYTIVVTPKSAFPPSKKISVSISARDLAAAPNAMIPFSYTFTTESGIVTPIIVEKQVEIKVEVPVIVEKIVPTEIIKTVTQLQVNETVQEITKNVATPVLVIGTSAFAIPAILSILVAMFSGLPYLLLQAFIFLTELLGLRRKRSSWGKVYDSATKQPISLAMVRIYDKKKNKLVETRVTDRAGRFGFLAEPGSYYISVTKAGFKFPSELIVEDTLGLSSIYRGEVIDLNVDLKTGKIDYSVLNVNIPIDPEAGMAIHPKLSIKLVNYLRIFFRKFNWIFLLIGFIPSVTISILTPNKLNYSLAFGYLMLFVIKFAAKRFEHRNFGMIYDVETMQPIVQAVVRIFDKKSGKLLKTEVTGTDGRYSFLAAPGLYYLSASKEGYDIVQDKSKIKATTIRAKQVAKNSYFGGDFEIKTDKDSLVKFHLPLVKRQSAKALATSPKAIASEFAEKRMPIVRPIPKQAKADGQEFVVIRREVLPTGQIQKVAQGKGAVLANINLQLKKLFSQIYKKQNELFLRSRNVLSLLTSRLLKTKETAVPAARKTSPITAPKTTIDLKIPKILHLIPEKQKIKTIKATTETIKKPEIPTAIAEKKPKMPITITTKESTTIKTAPKKFIKPAILHLIPKGKSVMTAVATNIVTKPILSLNDLFLKMDKAVASVFAAKNKEKNRQTTKKAPEIKELPPKLEMASQKTEQIKKVVTKKTVENEQLFKQAIFLNDLMKAMGGSKITSVDLAGRGTKTNIFKKAAKIIAGVTDKTEKKSNPIKPGNKKISWKTNMNRWLSSFKTIKKKSKGSDIDFLR